MIGTIMALFFLYVIGKVLIVIYKKFIRKPHDFLKRYGADSYVLVTGATDGIGKEYCDQFAKKGFNLVLVSRTLAKLNEVADEFKAKYPSIKTHIIQFDFTKRTTIKDYETEFMNEEINALDISVIVNNIGISQRELFSQYTLEEVSDSINVNIVSQSYLNHIFLRRFLNRKNRCAMISMSSYSAMSPLVLSSMYCSTKIFDDYLIRTIAEENRWNNVDCISVRPQYVDTPSRKTHKREFSQVTTEQCVLGMLSDLGYDDVSLGHWTQCLQGIAFDLLPMRIKNLFRYIGNKEKFNLKAKGNEDKKNN